MKTFILTISLLALCGCAAQSSDVQRAASPSPAAGALPAAVPDTPPPLIKRQVPAPDAQSTLLGQRLLGIMVYFFTGTFDTVPQAAASGDSTPVRLHVAHIWPEKKGELWLYFEYANQADLRHPFRQRLYRFREAGGEMYADSFRLDDPGRWTGEWGKAKPFDGLAAASLREDPRCRLVFVKQMEAIFAGGTANDTCAAGQPGAAYERSEYYISSSSIRSWDRDFDASGRQVGGPPGPWEFRKIAR